MKCTKCEGPTRVVTVVAATGQRRRKCRWCDYTFYTREVEITPMSHGGVRRGEGYATASRKQP